MSNPQKRYFSILLSVSLLIIALSLAYYLVIFLPKHKTAELEWQKASRLIKAVQLTESEKEIQPSMAPKVKEQSILVNNDEWEIKKIEMCLEARAFDQMAKATNPEEAKDINLTGIYCE